MVAHLEPCWIFFRRQRDWFLLFRRTNMLLILWICCNGVDTLNVTVCQCHGNLTFFFFTKIQNFFFALSHKIFALFGTNPKDVTNFFLFFSFFGATNYPNSWKCCYFYRLFHLVRSRTHRNYGLLSSRTHFCAFESGTNTAEAMYLMILLRENSLAYLFA